MASVADTISNLALLGIVLAGGFVALRVMDSLKGVDQALIDAADSAREAVRGPVFQPRATETAQQTVDRIEESGGIDVTGNRTVTAEQARAGVGLSRWLRRQVGMRQPGFVERGDEIVHVDSFGQETGATLEPGDRFGDVTFTGTGFA